MHSVALRFTTALLMVASLAGCAKQSNDSAANLDSDSLIATNPVEAPSGDLSPQQPFEASAPPPSTPSRRTAHATRPQESRQAALPPTTQPETAPTPRQPPGVVVEWGSTLHVSVTDSISSESAKPDDPWLGTIQDPVQVGDRIAIPAGSVVHGTVKDAKPAQAGGRAMLALQVTSVDVNGSTYALSASRDPIVAASTRARNLGAIAGSAAAGALIGSAVGGGKGALVGGAVGGAAAGGAVARSKGFQAVVKPGTVLVFTVDKNVAVRP